MLQPLQSYIVPALVLVALYFIGQIKPIGRMYTFFIGLIGKPFARIEALLQPFQPWQRKAETKYPGLRTIVLLIACILALTALTAETENTFQALTALWGNESASMPLLPSFLSSAMGWLFISVSALFGGVWLEGFEAVPEEARLFIVPEVQKPKFERFIRTSFLLSLVTSVCFYALRPFFLANPDSNITHLLQVVVFVMLGVLVPLVGVIAVYVIGIGFHAGLSVVLALVWFVASVLADLSQQIQSHLQLSQRRSYEPAEEQQVMITQASGLLALSLSKESEILPEMTEKLVAFTFDDQFGSHMIAPMKTVIDPLFARSLIRASGRVGFLNSATTPRPGFGVDISPIQRLGSLKEQFAQLAENGIKVQDPVSKLPAPMIHFLDVNHGNASVALLEPMSRRLPSITHIVMTACSEADLKLTRVQEFFTAILQIPQTMIVLVDTTSDFAKQQGYPKLCMYIADAMVKLLLSPTHSSFNLSAIELVEQFGQTSRVLQLSFAVAPVATGNTPLRSLWMKPFTNRAVRGSYDDALKQALHIAKEVAPSHNVPSYLLFSCPFRDSRYHQFVQENNQQVIQAFPGTLTGAVAASGVSPLRPTSTTPFFVSVAAFRPLPFIVHDSLSEKSEESLTEEKHTASAVIPADMVGFDVPASDTLAANGKKNGRGRPTASKKEQ